MRTTRKGLEFGVEQLNKRLQLPTTAYTRKADGKLVANIGNLHICSNSPGDGVTRFQLAQMMNEQGGINVVGNRTLLGASAFEDYLRGIQEGIELAVEMFKDMDQNQMLAYFDTH
jgi:hypothetical protein